MFVSNSDNLGATMDLKLLTWFAGSDAPFAMEVHQMYMYIPCTTMYMYVRRALRDGGTPDVHVHKMRRRCTCTCGAPFAMEAHPMCMYIRCADDVHAHAARPSR